jgi:hypothetical protein
MPQSLSLAILVLGGVLLLLALSAGGFKMFGAELSGASGRWSRIAAGIVGVGLIGAATVQFLRPGEDTKLAPTPAPEAAGAGGAATAPMAVNDASARTASTSVPAAPALSPTPAPPERAAPSPDDGVVVATPSAETIWVKCKSRGQAFDTPAEITGPFPGALTLKAPPEDCSRVVYTVKFLDRGNGSSLQEFASATTRPLGPNETERLAVDRRATVARIYAEGLVGGCNTGALGTWGVIATAAG